MKHYNEEKAGQIKGRMLPAGGDDMENSIRLITRGDDLGSNRSANEGIRRAVEAGIVRNVSVMATCDAVEEAAAMLAGNREVCFGLHFVLTAEWDNVKWGPVVGADRAPSLVTEGGFFPSDLAYFREHPPRKDEVLAELDAQYAKLRGLGFDIRYLDTHMILEWGIDWLEAELADWAQRHGLRYWAYYCNFLRPAEGAEDPLDAHLRQLEGLQPGQYLFVAHPAVDSPEMRALGNARENGETIARTRATDILLFTDPRVAELCAREGIEPIRYDEAAKTSDSLPRPEVFFSS